jgi:threonine synthase
MLAYGAYLYQIRKFGYEPKVTREVMDLLQRMAAACSGAVQISAFRYSPAGMVGVRALACELAEQLPGGIDHVFSPAGGGGLVVAVGEGFEELKQQGKLKRGPAIECVQPEGNDTTSGPLRQGLDRARPVSSTTTISGLQVAVVNDGDEAIHVCRASHGTGHLVSDEAVYEAQARLAREEGIFSEPAGATALAGALLAAKNGDVNRNATIVCLVTGIGFKDEHSLDGMTKDSPCPMLDSPKDLEDAILASESVRAGKPPGR